MLNVTAKTARLWVPVSAVLVLALSAPVSRACGPDGSGFLPENSLRIPVGASTANAALSANATDEARYHRVLDRIESVYAPIFTARGARLVVQRLWSDATVNAYAERSGNQWIIKMYGGLARHPALTPDGLALIACHEIGHHLGGAPRYPGQWAANEGQSDYFAVMKCLRRVWENEDNAGAIGTTPVPASVTRQCEASFPDRQRISLCVRATLAGQSSAEVSRQIAGGGLTLSVDTPDRTRVSTMYDRHPAAQCRLDTYFQGSICQASPSTDFASDNVITGACALEKGDSFGYRPLCWYKPSGTVVVPTPTPTVAPTPRPTVAPTPSPSPSPTPAPNRQAPSPTILGQTEIRVSQPQQTLWIQYDVSRIPNATGIYLELIGPNQDFAQSGGIQPDPRRIFSGNTAGVRGQVQLVPARNLPNWGVYRYRVIALGGNGTFAVSEFSPASTLRLEPALFSQR